MAILIYCCCNLLPDCSDL